MATLADLSLGLAVRQASGRPGRLATVTLTMDHLRPARGALFARSGANIVETTGNAVSESVLTDEHGGEVVRARGWFFVMEPPRDEPMPAMPWDFADTTEPAAPALADLVYAEARAVRRAASAVVDSRAKGSSFDDELLGIVWAGNQASGTATGSVELGLHLGNRVGHLQGGAAYGLAALAARQVVGAGWKVGHGTVSYLRPGVGEHAVVQAHVIRRGGRSSVVDVTVETGHTCAVGRFTLFPDD